MPLSFIVFWFFLLLLPACTGSQVPASDALLEQPQTGIYGRVSRADGQPATGAWVFAYRSQLGQLRGPAEFAARVMQQGAYTLDLMPGRWFLVARNRQQGTISGPPKVGDAWAIYSANPVVLTEQQVEKIDFRLQGVAHQMLLREGSLTAGDTGFRGRLVDVQGQPLAGAIALAYRDTDFRRMPDQTSAAVGSDGLFFLYLAQPGRYCLAARQRTRGQPIQGEPYGLLGKGEKACRVVEQGMIIDVGDIRLTPFLR